MTGQRTAPVHTLRETSPTTSSPAGWLARALPPPGRRRWASPDWSLLRPRLGVCCEPHSCRVARAPNAHPTTTTECGKPTAGSASFLGFLPSRARRWPRGWPCCVASFLKQLCCSALHRLPSGSGSGFGPAWVCYALRIYYYSYYDCLENTRRTHKNQLFITGAKTNFKREICHIR